MSIARITIMNFKEERDVKMSEEIYMTVQKDYFPNAELVVNVQTGEKSLLSLAIYPSYEEAEKNLEGREKFQKSIENERKEKGNQLKIKVNLFKMKGI